MKSLLPFIFFFAGSIIMGCSHHRSIPNHPRWEATGNDRFDSLTAQFLESTVQDFPIVEKMAIIDSMDRISDKTNDLLLKIRTLVARSEVYYLNDDYSALAESLKNGFAITDSAKYPLEYNILLLYTTSVSSDYANGYKNIDNAMHYFEVVGDSSNVATALLAMAHVNWRISRPKKALELSMRADTIFKKLGRTSNYLHNKLNLALYSQGEERIRRLQNLLHEPVITSDPLYYQRLLTDYFLFTDSILYLEKAIVLIESNPELTKELVPVLGLTANYQRRHGQLQLARSTMHRCLKYTTSTTPIGLQAQHFWVLSQIFEDLHKPDSAYEYLKLYNNAADSMERLHHANEILAIDFERSLEQSRYQASIAIARTRLIIVLIIAFVLIAALATAYLINQSRTRSRLRQLALENDLQRARCRMEAHAAVMQEMEKVITDIKSITDNEQDGKNVNDKIDSYLRLHEAGKKERESFMQIHEDLSPTFSKRLKQDFPELTEGQLRMCSFIAIGMSHAQISQTLNISRESVRKARYRLRLALGLDKETTLEDFLRGYSQ